MIPEVIKATQFQFITVKDVTFSTNKPFWFNINKIPYEEMWADAIHWLPKIFSGKQPRMVFTYQNDNETLDTYSVE